MPPRNVQFSSGCYYHIYNRGVSKQPIFYENQNYAFLLRLVEEYILKLNIAVIAYCLMPNHYHFLLRQDGEHSAGLLPQRVFNAYTKAINVRYRRTGTLFEGRYKAVHVDRNDYLIHLCRYIHVNPVKAGIVGNLEDWAYSNYLEWIDKRASELVDKQFVNDFFPKPDDYRDFVLDYINEVDSLPKGLAIYLFAEK